jgi:hypothetical protein
MEHMWWADPAVLHALVAQLNDARTRAADSSETAEEALGDSAVPSGPDGTAHGRVGETGYDEQARRT